MKTEFTCGNYEALWTGRDSSLIDFKGPSFKKDSEGGLEDRVSVLAFNRVPTRFEMEEETYWKLRSQMVKELNDLRGVLPSTYLQYWM